uniref:(northern house mosquito) hypothetical protein n=1 Tax=Culex pipiens TaxID=7175 RepID=A0A8D8DS04_CULPI
MAEGIPGTHPARCDRPRVPAARVHPGHPDHPHPGLRAPVLQRAAGGQQAAAERARVSAAVQLHRARARDPAQPEPDPEAAEPERRESRPVVELGRRRCRCLRWERGWRQQQQQQRWQQQ